MANTTDTPTEKLNASSGVLIATRAMSGATDTWHEDLYAIPCEGGVLLSVWGHQALGEVPGDWYDDDGELLPMHQTADGNLRLPEVFLGHQVVDFRDGMFVGHLQPIGDAVLMDDAEDDTVRLALGALEWPLGDASLIKMAAMQIFRPTLGVPLLPLPLGRQPRPIGCPRSLFDPAPRRETSPSSQLPRP
jgi:hypothetical protein